MAIQNRTVTIKDVFATNANTTIPNPPVAGISYRNENLTAAEVGEGWPYKEIVDSAKFNEAMYEYTTICKQLETYGFLPWCADTDYPAGGCALGTDGNVYQAKVATGPSTTASDPVNDTSHTYWDLFYYGAFTANRAIASNASGKLAPSNVTATELGYLSGVTSAVQAQLNNKVALSGNQSINGVLYTNASAAANSVLTTVAISKAQNGYVKLGNGLIIQWGKTPQAGSSNVTLPVPYSNTNYVITTGSYSDDGNRYGTFLRSKTTTGFTIYSNYPNSSYSWITIGY